MPKTVHAATVNKKANKNSSDGLHDLSRGMASHSSTAQPPPKLAATTALPGHQPQRPTGPSVSQVASREIDLK